MPLKNLLNRKSVPILFMLIVGTVYFITLAPTVTQIDTGELAAVQSLLGIAHPTGYPLFTVLGNLFLKFPLFQTKIHQLNFLAMVWCILGAAFFVQSSERILDSGTKESIAERKFSICNLMSASAAGLFLAFSKTFWAQGTYIDVFSLHLLLTGMTLFFSFRCLVETSPTMQSWNLLAFSLALSFSNHMSAVFMLPSLLYLFFIKVGLKRSARKILLASAGIFLLTVSLVYAYLPVRAAQNPPFNWGNPVNWANLIRHVSGRQYSVWMFKSSEAAWLHLNRFLENFPSEFSWFGLILGLIGFVSMLVRFPRLFFFVAVSFLTTVLYAINYDIHDLDSYFLLAYISFACWIAFGIKTVLDRSRKNRYLKIGCMVLLVSGIAFEAVSNFKENDLSHYYVFEDYSKHALDSLPENALLITYQWDYLVSPAYYFQSVELWRKDVVMVDKELLRRSWYFHQLQATHSEILKKIQPEVAAFLESLAPFEKGGVFNPQLLDRLYARLIQRLIETNLTNGGVFLGPELIDKELRSGEVILPQECRLIPDLFFYRVVPSDAPYLPLRSTALNIRFPKTENPYVSNVKQFLARMVVLRTAYESQNGNKETETRLQDTFRQSFPDIRFPEQAHGPTTPP